MSRAGARHTHPRDRAGVDAGRLLRHALTVWVALLALVLQLSAAGACAAHAPMAQAGGQGPFPICHSHRGADDPGPTPGGHDPSQPDACPFCATHCGAAIALAPTVAMPSPAPVAIAAVDAPRPQLAPAPARYRAGASPRGPPRVA